MIIGHTRALSTSLLEQRGWATTPEREGWLLGDRRTTGGRPLRVDGVEVSRHYVTFVEGELRLYPARKRRLAYLETCIATATPHIEEGMPKPPGFGNPTLNRAIALAQDQERAWLKAWVEAIEGVYNSLTPLQQMIIKLLYFERRLTVEGVALELGRDAKTIRHHRNQALLQFITLLTGAPIFTDSRKTPVQQHNSA